MLPKAWQPVGGLDLVRIGRNEDGGYIVPAQVLDQCETLLSFGLSDDCSFERDFVRRSGCTLDAYDHTVHPRFWLKRVVTELAKSALRPANLPRAFRVLDYWRLFSGPGAEHLRRKVVRRGMDGADADAILARAAGRRIFMKIDIEGWEYRVLAELLGGDATVLGFVVEFHDIDLHEQRISGLIRELDAFRIVHVHANNFADIDVRGRPLSLEFSFAHRSLFEGEPEAAAAAAYPVPGLDYPNDPSRPDIALRFA